MSRRGKQARPGLVADARELREADKLVRQKAKRHRAPSGEPKRPGPLGWTVRGGGQVAFVEPATEWRGTTVQVCGLWPFAAGSGLPTIGVPLGRHLVTGATVCADPINWFVSRLINTPSAFVLGRPGLGKSTLVRRTITGLADQGVWALVLGDLKPDYRELTVALGGQVIRVSRDQGTVNPLDLIGAHGRVCDLPEAIQTWAVAQLVGMQTNTLHGLLTLVRGRPLDGEEVALLSVALNALQVDPNTGRPLDRDTPVIRDVLDILTERHPALRQRALDSGDDELYDSFTRGLRGSLMALLADGPFGSVFDGQTSTHMRLDRPVAFDLSDLDGADRAMQAAIQLVCWAYGSATVAVATRLADMELGPRRRYLLVMDELWRMLRASSSMVDRVDTITRINRELGIGQIMCTHTMADLRMETERETRHAWGFVERSSMVFLGGLAEGEFGNLKQVFALSRKEQTMITDWSVEGNYDPASGEGTPPAGRGKFLLKLGKKPGTPLQVLLAADEWEVNDTNRRWAELAVVKRSGHDVEL